MPLLYPKKIGGFKIAISKKTNYSYQIAALVIGFCLLGAVVYGILYASNSLGRLFNDQVDTSGGVIKFNLEAAQKNSRLLIPVATPEPSPILSPSVSPAALESTSTPAITPQE